MDYTKLSIELIPDNQENRDITMAHLAEMGFESFVENEQNLEAYIQSNLYKKNLLDQFVENKLITYNITSELIPDQNWNEVWEKNYFKPLLIENTCLIRAPFHTIYPSAEFELVIEPKMAFGTGNHETTSLMIKHILEMDLEGKTVLDMGCGTGVLGMLASMKKAKSILAIDIDKWAFESTLENSAINNCKNIEVKQGDASLLGIQKFDLVFANIHKNILLSDMEKYAAVLNKNGTLVMSGFYEYDLKDISSHAENLLLTPLKHYEQNNWVAAAFAKK